MKRRDFLTLTGAAGLSAALPRMALAQQVVPRAQGGRPWRIAFLSNFTVAQSEVELLGPFRKALADLGYVEGRDYTLEVRYTDGDATRDPAVAKEAVALAPDLIATQGGGLAAAAHELTTSISIIAASLEPSARDLLVGTNLARPIGNVTGMVSESTLLIAKHCELALELLPAAKRIGVLVWSLDTDGGALARETALSGAAAQSLTPVILDVAQPTELLAAFRSLADARADAVVVGRGGVFAGDRSATVAAAATVKLPAIYNNTGYVEAGGLISYSYNTGRAETSARLASFADRIFRGAKPSDLPVEQPSSFTMAVNLKTAKSLGLTIPPTVLFRADLVIE